MEPLTRHALAQTSDASQITVSLRHTVTVIGYGDLLRGDDAVGQVVAQHVAAWQLPGVHALAVHQLTPELAETIAMSTCVMFVDGHVVAADQHSEKRHVSIQPIAPVHINSACDHITDPRDLLTLTETLYGSHPRAWRIHIPAVQFGFGTHLSPEAQEGVQAALRVVRYMISTVRNPSAA